REPSMPSRLQGTTVHILAIDSSEASDLFSGYREALIGASKVTARVRLTAAGLQRDSASETVRAISGFVNSSITSTEDHWSRDEVTSADEALQSGEGSRAATIIALTSALGLKADLVLGAELDSDLSDCHNLSCYQHPLVRVTLAPGDGPENLILLDPVAE